MLIDEMNRQSEYLFGVINQGITVSLDDANLFINFLNNNEIPKEEKDKIRDVVKNNLSNFSTFFDSHDINAQTKAYLAVWLGDGEIFNRFVKKIKNASELSVEELDKLPEDIGMIVIEDKEHAEDKLFTDKYTRNRYRNIRIKIDEIISGIEVPVQGEFKSEYKAFEEVCRRLSKEVEYNERAWFANRKYRDYLVDSDSNLECLLNGIGLCEGLACAARNVFSCLGMEAKQIEGFLVQDEEVICTAGHAWNQIKVGGQWFNFDLTKCDDEFIKSHEQEFGYLALFPDYYFRNNVQYRGNLSEYKEKADVPAIYLLCQNADKPLSKEQLHDLIDCLTSDIKSTDRIPCEQYEEALKFISDNYEIDKLEQIEEKDIDPMLKAAIKLRKSQEHISTETEKREKVEDEHIHFSDDSIIDENDGGSEKVLEQIKHIHEQMELLKQRQKKLTDLEQELLKKLAIEQQNNPENKKPKETYIPQHMREGWKMRSVEEMEAHPGKGSKTSSRDGAKKTTSDEYDR